MMLRGMGRVLALGCFGAVVFCGGAVAAQELEVLGGEVDGQPAQEMMRHYLNALAEPYFEARRERYEALESPEDIAAYQERQREFFVGALGGLPERTPLNARTVGEGGGEGYRFEKVIFESMPGFHVTATLYLPEGAEAPYPGVLVSCGHAAEGKASEIYQRAAILLAMNGMAALLFDPIAQGERYFFFQEDGTPEFGSTVHHSLMGVGAILLGTNTATYRIWDGIRALDYLESRPEVDGERLGCTGNSGGGTLTSYLMALDSRIKVAAPSCYITSFPRLMATIGPQDAEQNIQGQIAFGMDHADYIHMRAPLPTLITAATRDFFDIDGTWDSYREAKRLYTRLGQPERVSIIEYDGTHGWSQPLREGMVQWMRRWLLEVDAVVEEPDFPVRTPEELYSTPDGQVAWLEGARSVYDLNAAREEALAVRREAFWTNASDAERRERVWQSLQAAQPEPSPYETGETLVRAGYTVQHVMVRPEPGIVLPGLFFLPEGGVDTGVLYLPGESMAEDAAAGGPVEALVREGRAVLALELRGIGETRGQDYPSGSWTYVGTDWPDTARAYLLNKTIVGMRTEDVLRGAGVLQGLLGAADADVALIATGEATVPALHAAALAPEQFAHTTLRAGIPSWAAVVHEPRATGQMVNTVHGVLAWYDLPLLADWLGEARLSQEAMAVPTF